jgi:hypothetical protein
MIRLFVGCAANHEDLESQAVLEWSIRKHASEPVEITWMRLSRDPASPWSGWATERWATPFSGFRWAIPEVCGFEGRAIYCDSDVIFMADVAELVAAAIPAGSCGARQGWRLVALLREPMGLRRGQEAFSAARQDENEPERSCRDDRLFCLTAAFDAGLQWRLELPRRRRP